MALFSRSQLEKTSSKIVIPLPLSLPLSFHFYVSFAKFHTMFHYKKALQVGELFYLSLNCLISAQLRDLLASTSRRDEQDKALQMRQQ